ncbi:hypothetical protein [Vibrio cholerae]|uniref:hypothetical protein n=1 Tax=Vibrio cholerae TaxID=666 RepID=UPI001651F247|nr:hypothetical protein [Vibrio cholerae]
MTLNAGIVAPFAFSTNCVSFCTWSLATGVPNNSKQRNMLLLLHLRNHQQGTGIGCISTQVDTISTVV